MKLNDSELRTIENVFDEMEEVRMLHKCEYTIRAKIFNYLTEKEK